MALVPCAKVGGVEQTRKRTSLECYIRSEYKCCVGQFGLSAAGLFGRMGEGPDDEYRGDLNFLVC